VQASRDITRLSKKIIFALHRVEDGEKERNLERCDRDLAKVEETIAARIAAEIPNGEMFWRFHYSVSPCLQEYVEAILFLEYSKAPGELCSRNAIQDEIGFENPKR